MFPIIYPFYVTHNEPGLPMLQSVAIVCSNTIETLLKHHYSTVKTSLQQSVRAPLHNVKTQLNQQAYFC